MDVLKIDDKINDNICKIQINNWKTLEKTNRILMISPIIFDADNKSFHRNSGEKKKFHYFFKTQN